MKVLAISDLHCGSLMSMAPEKWRTSVDVNPKAAKTQQELWNFYSRKIDELRPIDRLMVLGDCIDGKGKLSGGTELITPDRVRQADLAAYCINYAEAEKVIMVYGTGYHEGKDEDWEDVVAGKVKNLVKIGNHEWPSVNGVVFDIKHKIGASSVPHGRMTALAKAKLWNQIWHAEHESQPDSNVILRGHVHYHNYCGGRNWLAMSLPALQGYGSKFGARQCEGLVQIGMVVFNINEKGDYSWKPHLAQLPQQKAQILPF